jgi:predicted Fe-Mo cluster-binding NifX family protein
MTANPASRADCGQNTGPRDEEEVSMKIAISATGPNLNDEVDPRFGRCQYFIIVESETMQFKSMQNPNIMAAGGAGISTSQTIANSGVQVVLTGDCGPNAYQVLSAAGVQVITGVAGKIRDVVQGYKSGKFKAVPQPNVGSPFGMGMGRGKGRGKVHGRGVGVMSMAGPSSQPASPEQEIEALKAQSQMLAQQLSEIQHRIEDLEKGGR